jgi:hypothetical protein
MEKPKGWHDRHKIFLVISCINNLDTIQFFQKGEDFRGKGEQVVA